MNSVLACPLCHGEVRISEGTVACEPCAVTFGRRDSVYSFVCREMYGSDAEFDQAARIVQFWGEGWEKRLLEPDHKFIFELDEDGLLDYVRTDLRAHRANRSLMGTELDLSEIRGKVALNIGCGAGTESLLLSAHGAKCIGMDITSPAANAADFLIRKARGSGFGIQADARFVPVKSGEVDLVYSSGVLHHSPDIRRSIDEVHRVLRRGGRAYLMLYARWSLQFTQERVVGFLKGKFSRANQDEHMSSSTEGAWVVGSTRNPLTQTFSQRECRDMFSAFSRVRIRQGTFSVRQVRVLGRLLAGVHGVSFLDRRLRLLDPYLGACLYVDCEK